MNAINAPSITILGLMPSVLFINLALQRCFRRFYWFLQDKTNRLVGLKTHSSHPNSGCAKVKRCWKSATARRKLAFVLNGGYLCNRLCAV